MRIAFDGRSLVSPVLRGWDRYTVGLVSELVKRGNEVTLFYCKAEPPRPNHTAGLGCRLEGLRGYGLLWEQFVLPSALWRGGYDLYHAPAEHGVPLVAPCAVVLTVHSVTWHSYSDLIRRGQLPGKTTDYLGAPATWKADIYWKTQVARADRILTPSAFSRREIIHFLNVPGEKVAVVPLGVPSQFRARPRLVNVRETTRNRLGVRRPYLLYVGGYEPHKNVPGLLQTFALVRAKRHDLSLVLVGSKAVPPELISFATKLGLQPSRDVLFLLDLGEELTDLYDDAQLFASLSWRESFGLPVLEAMSRGLRVVGSQWGATGEIADGLGTLVDPRDHLAAADAILRLLDQQPSSDLCDRLRIRASEFDWSRTTDLTLEIYLDLTSKQYSGTGLYAHQ
jgi:glycosyltransferase involved in cell wall biosynthesis